MDKVHVGANPIIVRIAAIYNCLYLALAQRTGGILVTADCKFHNALKTTRLDRMLLRIENIPG